MQRQGRENIIPGIRTIDEVQRALRRVKEIQEVATEFGVSISHQVPLGVQQIRNSYEDILGDPNEDVAIGVEFHPETTIFTAEPKRNNKPNGK